MNACLIDAHALLWHRNRDERLSETARGILTGDAGIPVISDATFWEIVIKHALGKLKLTGGPESLREDWIGAGAARPLPVRWPHIRLTGELPFIHSDPFDRMLVSQAIVENLPLVTSDPNIAKYPGIRIIW